MTDGPPRRRGGGRPRGGSGGPPARRGPATAEARPRGAASAPPPPIPWALLGALALLPLWWKSRSPTLGMPVADDYLFLSRLAFERPLDLFGPMGAAYYWRPLSRQAYYLLVGPWLERAPWVAALLAALLLLALYLVLLRLARRVLDHESPWAGAVAAAVACSPLLAEPARVLLAWPSAAQHLLGALFAALALERAFAGGLALSALAALLALLSNEAAFLVLPALPLVGWLRARTAPSGGRRRETLRWGAAAALVAALWAAGYLVARAHGAGLPAGGGQGARWDLLPAVVAQAFLAQLGLEAVPGGLAGPLLFVLALIALAGLAGSFARPARRRLGRAAPVLLGGLAWFLAGVVPLVFVLPDWNGWRTTIAGLGLALAFTGWLGLVSPALAGALVAFRLLALLLAPGAPVTVTSAPPPTLSSFSLPRIVRLQRTVESARRVLAAVPGLPRGAVVRYSNMPLLSEVGFNGATAPRVWRRDSTLTWRRFGGLGGFRERADVLIEFGRGRPWPAVRISPEALRLRREAFEASQSARNEAADSLLLLSLAAQPPEGRAFIGALHQSRAALAFNRGEFARAESLLDLGHGMMGDNPPYFALAARFALLRGDRAGAAEAVRRCLALDPRDPNGLDLARTLGITPAAR